MLNKCFTILSNTIIATILIRLKIVKSILILLPKIPNQIQILTDSRVHYTFYTVLV